MQSVYLPEVVEHVCQGGVLGPDRLFDDSHAALVEGLGLGVATLQKMENGEIAERDDHRGVIGPVEALGESERLLCDGRCFAVLAGLIELIDLGIESVQLVGRLGASRIWPGN